MGSTRLDNCASERPTWVLTTEHGFHSKERKKGEWKGTMEDLESYVKTYFSHSLLSTTKMFYKWSNKECIPLIYGMCYFQLPSNSTGLRTFSRAAFT